MNCHTYISKIYLYKLGRLLESAEIPEESDISAYSGD